MRKLFFCLLVIGSQGINPALADDLKVKGATDAGIITQSQTGTGGKVDGELTVGNIPTDGPGTLSVTAGGGVQLNPKKGGGATAPAAHAEVKVSYDMQPDPDAVDDSFVNPNEHYSFKVAPFARLAYDRNKPMDRDWSGTLAVGLEGNVYNGHRDGYMRFHGIGEARVGVGKSGEKTLPYLTTSAEASIDFCLAMDPSKAGRNSLCLIPDFGAQLGFVQAGIDGGLGVKYEYRISDAEAGKSDSVRFRVGPEASGAAVFDLSGGHASGQLMLTAGVQAL